MLQDIRDVEPYLFRRAIRPCGSVRNDLPKLVESDVAGLRR